MAKRRFATCWLTAIKCLTNLCMYVAVKMLYHSVFFAADIVVATLQSASPTPSHFVFLMKFQGFSTFGVLQMLRKSSFAILLHFSFFTIRFVKQMQVTVTTITVCNIKMLIIYSTA